MILQVSVSAGEGWMWGGGGPGEPADHVLSEPRATNTFLDMGVKGLPSGRLCVIGLPGTPSDLLCLSPPQLICQSDNGRCLEAWPSVWPGQATSSFAFSDNIWYIQGIIATKKTRL